MVFALWLSGAQPLSTHFFFLAACLSAASVSEREGISKEKHFYDNLILCGLVIVN